MHLVYPFIHLFFTLAQLTTSLKLQAKNNYFIGFPDGQMIHRLTDDRGEQWHDTSNLKTLRLLHTSDAVVDVNDTRVCRTLLLRRVKTSSKPSSADETFAEITSSGFRHSHRKKSPTSDSCSFSGLSDLGVYVPNNRCLMETLTGGVAVADYDGDKLTDVFYTSADGSSRLYRNNGDRTFTDVTASANVGPPRYGSGAGWVDVDSDGDDDLLVTTVGDSRYYLYVNHGGRFTEEGVVRNVSMGHLGRQLAGMTPSFGDFDNDGFVDMYLSEWIYSTGKIHYWDKFLRWLVFVI